MTDLRTRLRALVQELWEESREASITPVAEALHAAGDRLYGVLREFPGPTEDGHVMSTLWSEFDDMAFNLRKQAHSGLPEGEGRALLDVARRIESALKRHPGAAPEPAAKPGPYAVTQAELAGAIKRAGDSLMLQRIQAKTEVGANMAVAAMAALDELRRALLTPPADAPRECTCKRPANAVLPHAAWCDRVLPAPSPKAAGQ